MIADMLTNKKINLVVTELFIRDRKLKISVFILQSYFAVLKNIRLNMLLYQILAFTIHEKYKKVIQKQ